jgi:hypothetical protein
VLSAWKDPTGFVGGIIPVEKIKQDLTFGKFLLAKKHR